MVSELSLKKIGRKNKQKKQRQMLSYFNGMAVCQTAHREGNVQGILSAAMEAVLEMSCLFRLLKNKTLNSVSLTNRV